MPSSRRAASSLNERVMRAIVCGRHGRACPTAVRHGLCLKGCTALILLDSRSLRINWTRERTKAVQYQNTVFHGVLKHIPWAVVDRLAEQHEGDRDRRPLGAKAALIAMLS